MGGNGYTVWSAGRYYWGVKERFIHYEESKEITFVYTLNSEDTSFSCYPYVLFLKDGTMKVKGVRSAKEVKQILKIFKNEMTMISTSLTSNGFLETVYSKKMSWIEKFEQKFKELYT